jgi:hypothetical protein
MSVYVRGCVFGQPGHLGLRDHAKSVNAVASIYQAVQQHPCSRYVLRLIVALMLCLCVPFVSVRAFVLFCGHGFPLILFNRPKHQDDCFTYLEHTIADAQAKIEQLALIVSPREAKPIRSPHKSPRHSTPASCKDAASPHASVPKDSAQANNPPAVIAGWSR